jgi:hypothetical protein
MTLSTRNEVGLAALLFDLRSRAQRDCVTTEWRNELARALQTREKR